MSLCVIVLLSYFFHFYRYPVYVCAQDCMIQLNAGMVIIGVAEVLMMVIASEEEEEEEQFKI